MRDEERFNLFTLTANGAAVDLVLGEAGLIEQNLLGADVTVAVTLSDPAGGAASATTVEVPVAVIAPRPEGWRFADANADDTAAPFVPAAYNFRYTQTNYADGGAPCLFGNQTHARIEGRCYATVPVREDAEGDSVLYVARDVANQQELVAPDTVNASDGGFGVLVTNDINVRGLDPAAITIYSLDDQGNLQAAGDDFATYFNYTVDTSYGANNGIALVIRQRMHAVLDTNGSVNPNASYAALDTLPLDRANQEEDLNYFFVVGDDEDNASRRAIAQVNFNVQTAGLNELAEVIHLNLTDSIAAVDLANAFNLIGAGSIDENGAGALNFPSSVIRGTNVLAIEVRNPDGAEKNQTVAVTVDIVASAGRRGPSDGDARALLTTGRVTGNQLARINGRATGAYTQLALGRGVTRRGSVDVGSLIFFGLARNAHGEAFIRVKFEERAADGRAFEPHYQYFPLRVNNVPEATSTIANVTIGGLISPVAEDAFVVESNLDRGTHLNITLTNDQFDAPRSLRIANARVNIQNSDHAGFAPDPDESTIGIDLDPDVPNRIYVDRALTYAAHAHGTTTLTLTTTGNEPRGFDGTRVNYAVTQQLQPATFEVTPVNDPIQVCGDRTAPCLNDGRLTISTIDSALETLRNNYGVFIRVGELVAYFFDEDLATNGSVADAGVVDVEGVNRADLMALFIFNASSFHAENIQAQPAAAANPALDARVIEVRADIELALASQDQYDALDSNINTELNLTVTIPDGDTASASATARSGLLSLRVAGDNVSLTGGIAEGEEVKLPGNSDVGTRLAPPFTLQDQDLIRRGGDIYTFTVALMEPTYGLNPNFLVWQGPASIPQGSTTSINRSLETSEPLTDARAGLYHVGWRIEDIEGTDTITLNGTFHLNVTDVNDPLLVASTPVENATYNLQTEFNADGSLRAGSKNLVFYFTDADLDTAASTATRGAAASVANVLDRMPAFDLEYGNGSAVDRATETRLVLGPPSVTKQSGNGIRVAVPMDINLTQAQYEDLLATGNDLSFQVNITMADRDVYGATRGTNRSVGSVFLRTGANASAAIPRNTYAGGRASLYREQALVGSQTSDAAAVFLDGNNEQLNIMLTDPDLGGAGDTYTYAIDVTDGLGMPIPNLLTWHEESQVPSGNGDNRTGNYIRFERMGSGTALERGPQPGVYTVAWSITEARGSLSANREVASSTFTLEILETPAPRFRPIADQTINEGEERNITFNVSLASSVPGDLVVNVNSTLFERPDPGGSYLIDSDTPLVFLRPGNVTGLTRSFAARNANVSLSGLSVEINALRTAIVSHLELVRSTVSFDDPYVGSHRINVTAYTTDVSGNRLVDSVVFNLTVANVNDPTGWDLSRPMAGTVRRGGQATLTGSMAREDRDRLIPGRALTFRAGDITILDSNLLINFTAPGIAAGVCKIPRAPRPVTVLQVRRTGISLRNLTFDLTDCAASDGFVFPNGVNNLYELSQRRIVSIIMVGADDYAELVGPSDATRRHEFYRYSPGASITIPFFDIAINTVDDLRSNLTADPAGSYRLEANLTLTSWTPIPGFTGIFDGNNHTITFASGATEQLFDTINSSATVTNLGVINSTLAEVNEGAISNSYATGASFCSGGFCRTGGLVDENRGMISYSYATGDGECLDDECLSGGLVGYNNGGAIVGSYAIGNTTCFGLACLAGGLVGYNNGGTIAGSYAIGNMTCFFSSGCLAGGLVGRILDGAITESYATGDTSCSGGNCGSAGLIGLVSRGSAITHTYATGNSSCIGGLCNIGGLVGDFRAGSTLTGSYRAQSAGTDAGDGDTNRTLVQLRCPTTAGATCEGATTYTGWNNTIWNFGTASDLPTLNDLPTCPTFRPNCRH